MGEYLPLITTSNTDAVASCPLRSKSLACSFLHKSLGRENVQNIAQVDENLSIAPE